LRSRLSRGSHVGEQRPSGHAAAGRLVNYRFGKNTAPWPGWDDEIIGIEIANGGGRNVWRFAHHRSIVASDTNPAAPYFRYEPIANVSPN
jgi:hypothetical protein